MNYGMVAGGVAGVIAVIALQASRGFKRQCPDCHAAQAVLRIPRNLRECLWGGYTCPRCRLQMDGDNHPISR